MNIIKGSLSFTEHHSGQCKTTIFSITHKTDLNPERGRGEKRNNKGLSISCLGECVDTSPNTMTMKPISQASKPAF